MTSVTTPSENLSLKGFKIETPKNQFFIEMRKQATVCSLSNHHTDISIDPDSYQNSQVEKQSQQITEMHLLFLVALLNSLKVCSPANMNSTL